MVTAANVAKAVICWGALIGAVVVLIVLPTAIPLAIALGTISIAAALAPTS